MSCKAEIQGTRDNSGRGSVKQRAEELTNVWFCACNTLSPHEKLEFPDKRIVQTAQRDTAQEVNQPEDRVSRDQCCLTFKWKKNLKKNLQKESTFVQGSTHTCVQVTEKTGARYPNQLVRFKFSAEHLFQVDVLTGPYGGRPLDRVAVSLTGIKRKQEVFATLQRLIPCPPPRAPPDKQFILLEKFWTLDHVKVNQNLAPFVSSSKIFILKIVNFSEERAGLAIQRKNLWINKFAALVFLVFELHHSPS